MTDPKPLVTLVVAVSHDPGNVADFLDSIGDVDPRSYEILFVSPAKVEPHEGVRRWVADHEAIARVITSDGDAAADGWNTGRRNARGEWVGHASTDDRLGEEFLGRASDHLAGVSPSCAVACAEVVYLDAETGSVLDTHPLRRRFREGAREVSLDAEPLVVPPDLVGTFVRRDVVDRAGIAIDPALSPFFDGRQFLSTILLLQDEPRLGLIAGARYEQRRVMHAKVAIAVDPTNPRRFTELVPRGYLDLLDRAVADGRAVPAWLQDTVINDLRWYVVSDARSLNGFSTLSPEVLAGFGTALGPVVSRVGVDAVWAYDQSPLNESTRKRLAALHEDGMRSPTLVVDLVDAEQGLMRLVYPFGGSLPAEVFTDGAEQIVPAYAKVRRITVFAMDRLSERIVWLPTTPEVTASLDGRSVAVRTTRAPERNTPPPLPRRRLWRRSAERFTDAWIMMDRATLAGDNAEHLYRYLANERPDVNAWFVLERSSPDWQRLTDEGFRLVEFRSPDHRELLSQAIHYASSHIDPYVYDPFEEKPKAPPTWKFTFLQHGVTKDDVSDWFNGKRIDRLVTVTRDEHASIVGDGTRYRFTEHEARLTGFPRHDGLLRKATSLSGAPDLITFMPTWRQGLASPHVPGQTMKALAPGFAETEFAQKWAGLMGSGRLRELIEDSGLELAMMPHPNLAGGFDEGLVPSDVRRLSYAGDDVQDVLSRTALLVTDYSSVAFDAAFIDRAVLYYQFDRDQVFGEGHFYRRGYFSYEDHGYGPVATTPDQALAGVAEFLANGSTSPSTYEDRRSAAFPARDGQACSRVYDSMLELRRRH